MPSGKLHFEDKHYVFKVSPKRAWRHKVPLKCIQNPFFVPSSIGYKHMCIQTWIHKSVSKLCHQSVSIQ